MQYSCRNCSDPPEKRHESCSCSSRRPSLVLQRDPMEADEVISVEEPEMFLAVSQWYRDFKQVSDEDVQGLLASGSSMSPAA